MSKNLYRLLGVAAFAAASVLVLGLVSPQGANVNAQTKVEVCDNKVDDDDDKLVELSNTSPPSVYGFGHEGYYRNVLAVLRGQAKPETDGRAGRKSLELILGIYESAKTGREVPIPLRTPR